MNQPSVSVMITTYNHARFIEQTVRSVLTQKTTFDFEVVIGDDFSNDGTREIVERLAKEDPRIRLVLQPKNTGGFPNLRDTLYSARGQYIAWVEGDDFWTFDGKLQSQKQILDTHPECVLTFHNARIFYDPPGDDVSSLPQTMIERSLPEMLTIDDIFEGNCIPTCTVMFRAGKVKPLPPWFTELPFGDWSFWLLNMLHGKAYYQNELWASYRKHMGGIWSSQGQRNGLLRTLTGYEAYLKHFDPKYHRSIHYGIARIHAHLAKIDFRENHHRSAFTHLKSASFSLLRSGRVRPRHLVKALKK